MHANIELKVPRLQSPVFKYYIKFNEVNLYIRGRPIIFEYLLISVISYQLV